MGYTFLTVLTSFTLLVLYSLSGAQAKVSNDDSHSAAVSNELLQKRPSPVVWLKSYPIRHMKPLNAYSVMRKDLQPNDVEFIDDSVNDLMEKRFDDYGHMR